MAKKIEDFSDEALEKELARRRDSRSVPPEPLKKPDFTKLRELVISGTETVARTKFRDDDHEHYVWEAAAEAVYGREYFAWYNDLMRG